jgi:predicted transcriptional regulator
MSIQELTNVQMIARRRQQLNRLGPLVISISRREVYLSQRELGLRMDLTRNEVANLESGRRVLRLSDFVLVAEALRISPEKLLKRIVDWNRA